MNSSRPPGLSLQRRAGRRKSTPTSPTSPTFQRKLGRSQDAPVFYFADATNTPNESPSIDLKMPSPTFDLASISPALVSETAAPQRPPPPLNRVSDDFGTTRPKFLSETMRPATSSASGEITSTGRSHVLQPIEARNAKESPRLGHQRVSDEASRRSSSRETREDLPSPIMRSATFWAQIEKHNAEEQAISKNATNSKRSRFNLLNPMSLLARRRSSQNTNKLDDPNVNASNLHVPAMPDNIEASIRGKIVHDFSAPRARRSNNENAPRPGPLPSPSYPRRPSDLHSPSIAHSIGTPASMHSPAFKEHFSEEQRPIQPTNTAYLHGHNLQAPTGGALPSFAKRLPLDIPNDSRPLPDTIGRNGDAKEDQTGEVVLTEPDLPLPTPPKKAHSPVSEIPAPPPSAIPKHMASTSSRFSFQLGQQGSIDQEKVLEEKHKEHAAKQPAQVRFSVASVDDMDGYDEYDAVDDDDGFDTGEITIRNIDLPSSQYDQPSSSTVAEDFGYDDDDEFGTGDIEIRNIDMPTSKSQPDQGNIEKNHRQSLQAFHFTPQHLTYSPSTAQDTVRSTPRDLEGLAIGKAEFKGGMSYYDPRSRDSVDDLGIGIYFDGAGIATISNNLPALPQTTDEPEPFDDSDLYFDDGEFGDDEVDSNSRFDENVLDDAKQIKDIPAENARRYEEALQRRLPGEELKLVSGTEDGMSFSLPHNSWLRAESPATFDKETEPPTQAGLTEGNLAAYHDILAMAANKAAADGKFDRATSFSQSSDDCNDSPFHSSMPGVSSRGSRYSNNMVSSGISDDDGFAMDDEMDDDVMIAAANAEALENDDDGFYGQEFGFYARAHGKDTADFSNGGYFSSRGGSNGVKRSHSGKNNFQEPSLTPITERSEWSTRNSVVSLPMHNGIPGFGQSLPSPGIAELLGRDSPIVEDEMSMSTLMRLRGKAFGGSSSSINSLTDRHQVHSSPLAHVSGYNFGSADGMGLRMSSPVPGMHNLSIAESEDEDDDGGRPTLTQNTPHKKHIQPASQSSQEQLTSSPMSRKGNHSRNSSGAESVSYARDTDGRWVLERRRTGDSGELELVGREYLVGTRI